MEEHTIVAAGWNPNKTYCHPPEWHLKNHTVYEPDMIPIAGTGILIGLIGLLTIVNRRGAHWFMFAATYATFACMNTSGLLVWTGKPNSWNETIDLTKASWWFLILDATFSSSTSLNFLFCGLDLWGFLLNGWSNRVRFVFLISCYATLFTLYYLSFTKYIPNVFHLLYVNLTAVGSSVFFISALARVFIKKEYNGILLLVGSITVGLTGLAMLQMPKVENFLCKAHHGYMNGMDIWYIQSDASLFLLLCYYFSAIGKKATTLKQSLLGKPLLFQENL